MPVVNFHLVSGQANAAQHAQLLRRATALYADLLAAPVERIRVFITEHPASQFMVGGRLASEGGAPAPFFDCIVMDGRPVEQRHRILAEFTELLVDVLGVDRTVVRGTCRRVDPDDWGIAGQPASVLRAAELRERALQSERSN
ncbi:MAG: tautomerase family protein [Pseudomonadota bacterium]|nr:tautomerase family protein [Pseudomonadota bacterium]